MHEIKKVLLEVRKLFQTLFVSHSGKKSICNIFPELKMVVVK